MEDANELADLALTDTLSEQSSKESDSIEIVSISSSSSTPDVRQVDGPVAAFPLSIPDGDLSMWLHPATCVPVIVDDLFAKFTLDDDNTKWLRPVTPPPAQVTSSSNDLLDDSSVFSAIFPGEDRSKWLPMPSNNRPPPVVPLFSDFFSNEKDTTDKWLLRPASPAALTATAATTVLVLPNHFADDDNSKWLHPASLKWAARQGPFGDNFKYPAIESAFYWPAGSDSLPPVADALDEMRLMSGNKLPHTHSYLVKLSKR